MGKIESKHGPMWPASFRQGITIDTCGHSVSASLNLPPATAAERHDGTVEGRFGGRPP